MRINSKKSFLQWWLIISIVSGVHAVKRFGDYFQNQASIHEYLLEKCGEVYRKNGFCRLDPPPAAPQNGQKASEDYLSYERYMQNSDARDRLQVIALLSALLALLPILVLSRKRKLVGVREGSSGADK